MYMYVYIYICAYIYAYMYPHIVLIYMCIIYLAISCIYSNPMAAPEGIRRLEKRPWNRRRL